MGHAGSDGHWVVAVTTSMRAPGVDIFEMSVSEVVEAVTDTAQVKPLLTCPGLPVVFAGEARNRP